MKTPVHTSLETESVKTKHTPRITVFGELPGHRIWRDSDGFWNILPSDQECTHCGYKYLAEIAKLKGIALSSITSLSSASGTQPAKIG